MRQIFKFLTICKKKQNNLIGSIVHYLRHRFYIKQMNLSTFTYIEIV